MNGKSKGIDFSGAINATISATIRHEVSDMEKRLQKRQDEQLAEMQYNFVNGLTSMLQSMSGKPSHHEDAKHTSPEVHKNISPLAKSILKAQGDPRDKDVKKVTRRRPPNRISQPDLSLPYHQVVKDSSYKELINKGFIDVTTDLQKQRAAVCLYHPKNPKMFFTMFGDGCIRKSVLKEGSIKIGESMYRKGNKVFPSMEKKFPRISDPSSRLLEMAVWLIEQSENF